MVALLEVNGLAFRFAPKSAPLFSEVTFALAPRRMTALIGATGSGKTTLLRCLAGELAPSRGTIAVASRDVTGQPQHRRAESIVLIAQRRASSLPERLTLGETIWLFATRGRKPLHLMRHQSARDAADEHLRPILPQLCDRLDDQVRSLSGGEYQAFNLACVAASTPRPSVLLLDEHVAHLDPSKAAFIMRRTEELVSRHDLAALYVTHDLELALAHAADVLVLSDGRLRSTDVKTNGSELEKLMYGPTAPEPSAP